MLHLIMLANHLQACQGTVNTVILPHYTEHMKHALVFFRLVFVYLSLALLLSLAKIECQTQHDIL